MNLTLDPTTDGGLTSTLTDSVLRVDGNRIVSQALGNSGDNSLTIDAGTSLGVTGTGAIGGVANSQTGATVAGVDITLAAVTSGNSINVSVLEGDAVDGISGLVLDVGDHTVDGVTLKNTIASAAFASIATNSVEASAGSIAFTSTGVTLWWSTARSTRICRSTTRRSTC